MRTNITTNSEIVKALEAKLNKDIQSVCEGVDEDRIYFADGTSAYAIFEFTFDKEIQISVTLLTDAFDVADKFIINY